MLLETYGSLIKTYNELPKEIQLVILKSKNVRFIKLLCEISLNIIKKNLPLSECQLKEVIKYKRTVKLLATKGKSLKRKRNKIISNKKLVNILFDIVKQII
jgi:hypothetical protein